MLTELRVENLGIVDDLTLTFPQGLVAITGETGAGKTLIVDALALLLGGRAEPGIVRAGATEARVEGRFVFADADGSHTVETGEHVLARVVPAEGRSRAYLDGRLATAGELAELGRELVDLHGQHAHQSLLTPATQRSVLDAFAGSDATRALEDYRAAREGIAEIDASLAELGGDPQSLAREVELLRYQLDEIDQAELEDAAEDERLADEIDLLGDAQAHRDALAEAVTGLDEGAAEALGLASTALRDRRGFADHVTRIDALTAELAEVVRDLRATLATVEDDPARLETLQARKAVLTELRRKYGPDLADVLAFAGTTRTRLEELSSTDDRRDALTARRVELSASRDAAAGCLHEVRLGAATPLADAAGEHLRDLAMPRARIEVTVTAGEPGDDGADVVEFGFAANPGEPVRPLAKVASGGELARVMLALRVVLSAGPPTLIFDEVDAGIGGEAGSAVGRLLARVADTHQVLCVTHLAQVAAFADAQVAVRKRSEGDRTVADAAALAEADRVVELSRMLAGDDESSAAREHASELLAAARRA